MDNEKKHVREGKSLIPSQQLKWSNIPHFRRIY